MNSVTVRSLLVRGMIAGVLAGLLAFGLAYAVGEPSVNAAIAFEAAHTHEHGEEELVSRVVQSTAGLSTAVLVYGTALGGIVALAFCFALGRVGRVSARATAVLTALGGFVTVALVPLLKYPANPPAVGDPDTLNQRTALFFLMIALSVLLAIGAVLFGRRLVPRWGTWNATVAAAAAFTVVIAVAMVFLPAADPLPKEFPAGALWNFRIASLGIQALLWAAMGLIFGALAKRVLEPGSEKSVRPDTLQRGSAAVH